MGTQKDNNGLLLYTVCKSTSCRIGRRSEITVCSRSNFDSIHIKLNISALLVFKRRERDCEDFMTTSCQFIFHPISIHSLLAVEENYVGFLHAGNVN